MNMTISGNPWLLFVVFWPTIAAFTGYLIGRKSKRGRDYWSYFTVILEFGVMVLLALTASNEYPPTFEWTGFMGFRIYLMLDGIRAIYGIITALMWMMTTLLSREYFAHYHNRNRYYLFMLFTMTGTLGVFLSGDLLTLFMLFEMMSFTSSVMVIHDESKPALKASDTYTAVAVIGGLSMLMGIFLIKYHLGTTEIALLHTAAQNFTGNKFPLYLAAVFMLVGFGGKAGVYPLHIWLPNAHPVAPAPASALLSGVLTKTGIFGIIILSSLLFQYDAKWGMFMLILGVLGMFTGALLALFSTNLKRTLACSSVSQIGFIMVGMGMQGILGSHNALAVRGTLMHMVNHSLIKLVLFMMAGVLYMNLHELDLNKVRGFGRKKPLFTFAFAMGVLSIIGMPFWSGYVSKTMLHESIVEQIWLYQDYSFMARFFQVVESIFTFTGGMTTAYMIKIFVCVCIEKNQFNQDKMTASNGRYMNKVSTFALVGSAVLLPILGINPDKFMIPISRFGQEFMHGHEPAHAVQFFAWMNVKGAVASLAIGAILYVFVVRGIMIRKDAEGRSIYVNLWPKYIDIEEYLYRPLLLRFLPFVGALFARVIGSLLSWIASLGYRIFTAFQGWWRRNTGLGLGKEIMDAGRGFMEARVENPIINPPRMRKVYQSIATKVGGENEMVWDGEGDFIAVGQNMEAETLEKLRHEADEAKHRLPPDPHGHGHDDHAHDDHGHSEKMVAETEESLYNKVLAAIRRGYNRVYNVFRIRDERFADVSEADREKAKQKSAILRTVLSSLAYSLLLLLAGIVVMLLFL